jgi:predicted MFS family arabinose efflux permease
VSIPLLYAVAFLLGINETLFDNAAQSIQPAIVAPQLLEKANGRQYAAEMIANAFVGPPLGGLLFSVAIAAPFWIDSASFVLSALLIATVRGNFRAAAAIATADGAPTERRSIWADISEGVRWLRSHRLLRTLALLLGTMNMCANMAFATFVLFAQEILGLDERGYGVLLAAFAIGGVLGAMFGSRIAAALGPARALVLALGVGGAAQAVAGLLSEAWLIAPLFWVSGLLGIVWNVITVSLRQRIIPDHLLGRVNSVYRFLGWGSIPIGALLGGILADIWGLRAPFVIGGLIQVAALVVALPRLTSSAIAEAEAAAPARAVLPS